VGRLVDACWTLVAANHKGEKLPDATLALYAEQLRWLDEQRKRMQELISVYWQMIGRENPQ
jgi:hypothetical protein